LYKHRAHSGNISNGLTIGSNFDLMSEGLLEYAKETPGAIPKQAETLMK
jgi:hypothetical protein